MSSKLNNSFSSVQFSSEKETPEISKISKSAKKVQISDNSYSRKGEDEFYKDDINNSNNNINNNNNENKYMIEYVKEDKEINNNEKDSPFNKLSNNETQKPNSMTDSDIGIQKNTFCADNYYYYLGNLDLKADWMELDEDFNKKYFEEYLGAERQAFNKHSKSLKIFGHKVIDPMSEEELFDKVTRFQSHERAIQILDFIISIFNFVQVCIFYNEHFVYIDNNYVISNGENILRWIFLGVSFLTVFLIVMRYKNNLKKIKILVELEAEKQTELGPKTMKSRRIYLFLEIIIHLLQPYPYLEWHFDMEIVGNMVTYSLNMFLYFLCTIRLYYLLKLIYGFNLFGSMKSKRLLEFYSKSSKSNIFLIKANLDYRGFATLMFIVICFLVYFALLLKVLEYFKHDKSNPFYYFTNSVWYLLITMGTIGYGDITPKTVIGRIIGAAVCLVGVIVLSLIVVTLTIFTYLNSDEQNAYMQIINNEKSKVLKTKLTRYASKIINNFIKIHMKKIDLKSILDTYQIQKDKLECKNFMQKEKEAKDLQAEFVTSLRYIADKHLPNIIDGLGYIWDFEDNFEDYLTTNDTLYEASKESKNTIFRCLNLAKCLMTIGSVKSIKSINEIQHKKALTDLDFQNARNRYLNTNRKTKRFENSFSLIDKKIRNSQDVLFENNELSSKGNNYFGSGEHKEQKRHSFSELLNNKKENEKKINDSSNKVIAEFDKKSSKTIFKKGAKNIENVEGVENNENDNLYEFLDDSSDSSL